MFRRQLAVVTLLIDDAKSAEGPAIERIGEVPTGHYPRSMALDPSGRVLVVANQKGASVATYTRDATSGRYRKRSAVPVQNWKW